MDEEYKGKIKLWECFKGEYPISQRFGEHFYKDGKCVYVAMGLKAHNGVDFALPIGTKLVAVADGLATSVLSEKNGYGNHVRLHCCQEGINYEITYGHCSKFLVKQGEKIVKGQIIAESGNSGFSSGPHLHFGLRILDDKDNVKNFENGYKGSIDPLPFFDLSEANAPKNEPAIMISLDKCEPWAVKYWQWFREQGFDLTISAYDKVDAQWVATILGKYNEMQKNEKKNSEQ